MFLILTLPLRNSQLQSTRGRSRTLSSLRLALGPSLGTLCCGSAVLTLVAMVRQVGVEG